MEEIQSTQGLWRFYMWQSRMEMVQMVLVLSLAIRGSQIYKFFSEHLLSMDKDGMSHSENKMPYCVGFATGMSSEWIAPQSWELPQWREKGRRAAAGCTLAPLKNGIPWIILGINNMIVLASSIRYVFKFYRNACCLSIII